MNRRAKSLASWLALTSVTIPWGCLEGTEVEPQSFVAGTAGTADTSAPDASTGGAANADASADAGTGGGASSDASAHAGAGGTGGTAMADVTFTVNYQRADEMDPDAPGTVYIVTWSVDPPSVDSAVIEFGPDTGYGMTAPVDLDEPEYRTVLVGMNPSRTYNFRVVTTSGGIDHASDNFEIETGPATNLVTVSDFEVLDESAHEPGFIVAAVGDTAVIIGPDGEIVWWHQSTVASLVTAARMSDDAKNLWLAPRYTDPRAMETGPLERVRMDALETQVYEETAVSHDLAPVAGETMAFINYGFGGDCSDSVIEIDNSGATTEVFRAWEYLDDCHINALRYNAAEDVYSVSDRSSTVFVVNRAGEAEWRLSDVVSNESYGGTQHGHHLLQDEVVILANHAAPGSTLALGYSRLDGSVTYRYDGHEYTNTLGTVQRLPGGNTLVTYSNAGAIHEADPEGNTVMRLQTSPMGFAAWRADLYGPASDVQTW